MRRRVVPDGTNRRAVAAPIEAPAETPAAVQTPSGMAGDFQIKIWMEMERPGLSTERINTARTGAMQGISNS